MGYYENEEVYAKAQGRKVSSVEMLDESGVRIKFEDDHEIGLVLEGDCCSHSYFTDSAEEAFEELVGSTIQKLEERSGRSDKNGLPDPDEDEYHSTLWYFLVITTDKGHVTIDWRNDSNGYYSGSILAEFR